MKSAFFIFSMSICIGLFNQAEALTGDCLSLQAKVCLHEVEQYSVRVPLSISRGNGEWAEFNESQTYSRFRVVEKDADGKVAYLAKGLLSADDANSVLQKMSPQKCLKISKPNAKCYQYVNGSHFNEFIQKEVGAGEYLVTNRWREVNVYDIGEGVVGSPDDRVSLKGDVDSLSEAMDTLTLLRAKNSVTQAAPVPNEPTGNAAKTTQE